MYKLEVVTPEGIVFDDDVYMTVVKTADGEVGILENHMLLLTNVVPGKLEIYKEEGSEPELYAVTWGIIDVRGDRVIILVEEVYKVEEIDVEKEELLLKKAEAKLAEREKLSLKEIEEYERLKERALALLELAGVKVA